LRKITKSSAHLSQKSVRIAVSQSPSEFVDSLKALGFEELEEGAALVAAFSVLAGHGGEQT
jgi:hypothetical protein